MHAGSGGTHDGGARSERVVKETTVGQISVSVEYPTASVGEDIIYFVHVSNAVSMRPIADAHIRTRIRNAPASHASDQSADHVRALDTSTQSPGVRRLDEPGVYAFNHRQDRTGSQEISVTIDAIGDSALDSPVTVSAVREVSMAHDQGTTGSKGRAKITPTIIVVGAAMIAMMALMMRTAY